MSQAFPNTISRQAAVVAPGLMVMGIILFMGKVSGAHLNPAVSLAFALRSDFPWRRVPGYIVVQLIGAALAAWFCQAVINVSATYGSNYPAHGYSAWSAVCMEGVLTLGLVSVILGTASGAQNIGIVGAFGVGGYIALAGLWGSPISGTSMNPARTFGPDLIGANFTDYWVYVVGPLAGALVAVGFAFALRGRGGRAVRLRCRPRRPEDGGGCPRAAVSGRGGRAGRGEVCGSLWFGDPGSRVGMPGAGHRSPPRRVRIRQDGRLFIGAGRPLARSPERLRDRSRGPRSADGPRASNTGRDCFAAARRHIGLGLRARPVVGAWISRRRTPWDREAWALPLTLHLSGQFGSRLRFTQ